MKKATSQKQRFKRATLLCIIAFAILLIYAAFVSITGFGIPCYFNLLTGLKCPSCGVTHMCLDLMRGDIVSAAQDNFAILTLIPFLIYFSVRLFYLYVKTGTFKLTKPEVIILWIIVVYLAVFGFVRNEAVFFIRN